VPLWCLCQHPPALHEDSVLDPRFGHAVHHATGIRVRDLPITLDKLLQ
jgi:hypothetical protein